MKKTKIAQGVILGAVAALAAYFLTSDKTKKQRETLCKWAMDMKAELIKKIKNMKDLKKEDYEKMVAELSKKYSKLSKVSRKELNNVVAEIKDGWKHIKKAI
ncbi:MAG TPA: hypothetical protein PLN68_08270 [Elusimicrobiales bacterium]|nr:hypothetical protein [Elusimicrobiales bacterium]